MLYDGNKSYYPLIQIGQDVQIGPDESDTIQSLCVSPSGRIAIIEQDPFATNESDLSFLKRMTAYSDEMRSWSWSHLEEIAADFYYRTEGQSFRIIDLMARAGFLTFTDEGLLSIKLDRGLKTAQHLVIISSPTVESFRRSDFSSEDFTISNLLFAFVDDKNRLPFISK